MECAQIHVTTYSDFSKRLYMKTDDQRMPVSGSIEVTARCNLRCVHCYINLPLGDQKARERELKSIEWFSLIDQIVEEGCLWLLLTGGEPFIRPDFIDIYTYAKKKGLLITLFTNGTTITPRIADYLAEWRPFSIEITLYGYTQETYERVTGVLGSYERCMRTIELLLERNISLMIKSVIMTLNKHEIWDMKAYADRFGVKFRFDPILNLRSDGSSKPATYRIPPNEVVTLDLMDEKRIKEWHEFCKKFLEMPLQPEYLYQCGAGIETFHIDPYGQLSACMMARVPSFNMRPGKFREGWNNFIPRVLAQRWSREVPCKGCKLISLCDQCPGWAQIEHGDHEARVEYLCEIAHMRAEAFGLK